MEDSALNTRRGTAGVTMNDRQGSSWASADMHYQHGNNNFASGSGTSSDSGRVQQRSDVSESWEYRRSYGQDFGKAPECSQSTGLRSRQFSPKLVVNRPAGSQRTVRSHSALSVPASWNAMQGFSGSVDSSGQGNMDTDINSGMGISTSLGLSEVPVLAGHRYSGSSQEYSFGKSGLSLGSNSDLYPVNVSGQASSLADYNIARSTGQASEIGNSRSNTSSGLPYPGRSTGLNSSTAYHIPRSTMMEGTKRDLSLGFAVGSSFPMDREDRDATLHHGSSSGYNALSDPLMASSSTSQDLLGEEPSSDSHVFLSSAAVDRAREPHSLKGNSMSSTSPSGSNVINRSRASACKRKSCTSSSLLVSPPCQSRFHHSSGLREGYGTKSIGGFSSGRRNSRSTSCVSVSDVVASASAVVSGRCAETSVAAAAMEEPRPRKSSAASDGDSIGIGRAAKASLGVGSSAASGSRNSFVGGTGGQVDQLPSSKSQPPISRAVRRAIPPLQPDPWCSQSDSLLDCSFSDTDFVTGSGNSFVRSTDHFMAPGGGRRSGSPLIASSRSGASSSRRNDLEVGTSVGERLCHRYTSGSSRNMTSSASGAGGPFGGISMENRLRFRNHMTGSGDSVNTFGSGGGQSQPSLNSQGLARSGSLSGPSTSRLPPHPPVVRYRQNLSSLHTPVLSLPSSALAPSRLSPSPPPPASSFSAPMDMLLPGSSVFQSSLLSRSSSSLDGNSERGFGSNDDNRVGFPFRGLQLSDGEHHPRLVAEGLAEILLALDRVERDEDLTYEQLLMLEATLLFGGMGLHDQHSDLRLDVDNMSYEELLALEERIGNVSTGLTMDMVDKGLKRTRYSFQAAAVSGSQESDVKCTVCQEEYKEGDDLGNIDCGHSYHIACIKQWLVQKNQCPICKASALS